MKYYKLHIIIVLLFSFTGGQIFSQNKLTLNYKHLDYLYKGVNLPNGKQTGVIRIYSNYPNYNFDIEPKEGFACVDDAARALILFSKDSTQVQKAEKLTQFLLYMQNKNGWFNNFIWDDLSVNTTYKTSVAQPSWWSWRALWALESVLPQLKKNNPELAKKTEKSINLLIANIKTYLNNLPKGSKIVRGITIPTDLPFGSATDQASILIVGLALNFERTQNRDIIKGIRQLADGILNMQIKKGEAKGAFLSWENQWHAYGNLQSYALLKAGKLLKENKYIKAALLEINHFYPYLWRNHLASNLTFENKDNHIKITKRNTFAQIAYGIRPIIYAYTAAFKQTGKTKYKTGALKWLSWFDGQNMAKTKMYNAQNGRCFDGILSKTKINKNSGAESTIEALLSIEAVNKINKN